MQKLLVELLHRQGGPTADAGVVAPQSQHQAPAATGATEPLAQQQQAQQQDHRLLAHGKRASSASSHDSQPKRDEAAGKQWEAVNSKASPAAECQLAAVSAAALFEVRAGASSGFGCWLLKMKPTDLCVLKRSQTKEPWVHHMLTCPRVQSLPVEAAGFPSSSSLELSDLELAAEALYDDNLGTRAAAAVRVATLFCDTDNMEVRQGESRLWTDRSNKDDLPWLHVCVGKTTLSTPRYPLRTSADSSPHTRALHATGTCFASFHPANAGPSAARRRSPQPGTCSRCHGCIFLRLAPCASCTTGLGSCRSVLRSLNSARRRSHEQRGAWPRTGRA